MTSKKPIESLTMKEIAESGRIEEALKMIEELKKQLSLEVQRKQQEILGKQKVVCKKEVVMIGGENHGQVAFILGNAYTMAKDDNSFCNEYYAIDEFGKEHWIYEIDDRDYNEWFNQHFDIAAE
jgi:hypothetical protein